MKAEWPKRPENISLIFRYIFIHFIYKINHSTNHLASEQIVKVNQGCASSSLGMRNARRLEAASELQLVGDCPDG